MVKNSLNVLLIALVAFTLAPKVTCSTLKPLRLAAASNGPSLNRGKDDFESLNQRGGQVLIQDKAIVGAGAFLVMDTIVRKAFRASNIAIPPQLGGCIMLFSLMIILEIIMPGLGDGIFNALAPGAALLTKWLPVFFVPGLAMLPLAPSIGSAVDVREDSLRSIASCWNQILLT